MCRHLDGGAVFGMTAVPIGMRYHNHFMFKHTKQARCICIPTRWRLVNRSQTIILYVRCDNVVTMSVAEGPKENETSLMRFVSIDGNILLNSLNSPRNIYIY